MVLVGLAEIGVEDETGVEEDIEVEGEVEVEIGTLDDVGVDEMEVDVCDGDDVVDVLPPVLKFALFCRFGNTPSGNWNAAEHATRNASSRTMKF